MKRLRINLHIRDDVSPRLYEALASLPPRPRAELLRRLAELGLRPAAPTVPQLDRDEATAVAAMTEASDPRDRDAFGDELVRIVSGLP
ncbi:hypothetical protein SVA_3292 [Sulfurifustis variabilis]|uniref:Uncharacterized protein n=1 Tax=Sulfurifustis variabilis TaxID=1675686 RepID=A0A1C7AF33_9GAMM|nr:hypothetical protein [Sulfurifustis variabilis]BAU49840.1 hypothetical protein SVA_3292 [Sulfurifustis variabilis]